MFLFPMPDFKPLDVFVHVDKLRGVFYRFFFVCLFFVYERAIYQDYTFHERLLLVAPLNTIALRSHLAAIHDCLTKHS